jgi:type II secretory pathway component PulM
MKAGFYGLQPRERWILSVGAAIALIVLAWTLVLAPLRTYSGALRASVETDRRLLVDVARLEGSRPSSLAGNLQGADQTLAVIVVNTAQAHGLTQPRTRANGPSGIDVTFQAAPFDALAAWLVTLRGTYGVDVESASFSSGREPGLVNGQLSLHRL